MATVQDEIEGALRLIGQLEQGETPNNDTLDDAMEAFNDMIDSWSTERLAVFCTDDQVFTWPVNEISRTLGPTGDFVGNRPVQVDDSTYFKTQNLSYPLILINEEQYNGIAQKNVTSTYPQVMFVNYTMPDITMKIYPMPTSTLEMHIISVQVLTQATSLSQTLIIPPGYRRAFKYNLGVEIASEFGIDAPPRVINIANTAKKNIKRINSPGDVMSMPYTLVARRQRYNIFSGLPN